MFPFDMLLSWSNKNKMSQISWTNSIKLFFKNFKAELFVHFQSNRKYEDADLLQQTEPNPSAESLVK